MRAWAQSGSRSSCQTRIQDTPKVKSTDSGVARARNPATFAVNKRSLIEAAGTAIQSNSTLVGSTDVASISPKQIRNRQQTSCAHRRQGECPYSRGPIGVEILLVGRDGCWRLARHERQARCAHRAREHEVIGRRGRSTVRVPVRECLLLARTLPYRAHSKRRRTRTDRARARAGCSSSHGRQPLLCAKAPAKAP